MPVYEYEHLYDECELCDFRFAAVQGVDEEPLRYCPSCGLEVKRVVSRIAVVKSSNFDAQKAAKHGFTTWRKSGEGQWEKVAGEGVDAIVGNPDDVAAVQEEKNKPRVRDLDD